jgi:phospholipase D1/2
VVLGAFLAGALVFFPVTLLMGATVLLCGWPLGALYAWGAGVFVASLEYAAGRRARRRVRQSWSAQTMWLRGQLRRRGWLAVVVARLLPVSNFTVMNLVAGALRVPFRRFVLATALGLVPGILALALFTERVGAALREPGARNVFLLAALLAALVGVVGWLRRRLGRSTTAAQPVEGVA